LWENPNCSGVITAARAEIARCGTPRDLELRELAKRPFGAWLTAGDGRRIDVHRQNPDGATTGPAEKVAR